MTAFMPEGEKVSFVSLQLSTIIFMNTMKRYNIEGTIELMASEPFRPDLLMP